MKRRRSCLPGILLLFILVGILLVAIVVFVPALAWQSFGPPGPSLNAWQRVSYALDLMWNAGDLTQPRDPAGSEQTFGIQPGESVLLISKRLEQAGLIRNARTFRTYLLWTGLDTIIQTGTYRLSPAQTGREIAQTSEIPDVDRCKSWHPARLAVGGNCCKFAQLRSGYFPGGIPGGSFGASQSTRLFASRRKC